MSTEVMGPGAGCGEMSEPVERTEPGRYLEQAERRRMLEGALAAVPEPFRVVLILKEMEGLKYEEIAKILDLPVGTEQSRLHRARSDMRDRLKLLRAEG